jgi:short-subunit dehydrogenase
MPNPLPPHLHRYGPWALITGASSGIGETLAGRLAALGFHVVLAGRRADALAAVAARIERDHRVQTRCVQVDLSEPGATDALDRDTADLDLGLIVLNAGAGSAGPFLDRDDAAEAALIRLNCAAVVDGARRFGARLRDRGGGSLLFLSSILAFQGSPLSATYGASKAFVQAFAESLTVELRAHQIDVLCFAIGPTHTQFADHAGMRLGRAMSVDAVVNDMVGALGGRGTRFPGWLSKALRALTFALPRWVATRIFGGAMAGMVA